LKGKVAPSRKLSITLYNLLLFWPITIHHRSLYFWELLLILASEMLAYMYDISARRPLKFQKDIFVLLSASVEFPSYDLSINNFIFMFKNFRLLPPKLECCGNICTLIL